MKLQKSLILLAIFCATLLAGCLGGCGRSTAASSPATPPSPAISFDAPVAGVTPYISFVTAHGASLAQIKEIDYTIAAKPGLVSKPVSVSYSIDYLIRRGYAKSGEQAVTIPIFGLYANYTNTISLKMIFGDDSTATYPLQITAAAPTGATRLVYSNPLIVKARDSGSSIGFDYFYMESLLGTPVVVDTDGEVRWVGPGTMESPSSRFVDNGFLIGSPSSSDLYRFELDGATSSVPLVPRSASIRYTTFHHNINVGKTGLLVDVNGYVNNEFTMESLLSEIDTTGKVISEWDFNAIVANYMRSQGDDPTPFVRYGSGWIAPPDWFHLNSAIYDPSDDSIIASSRENFVIKIDYKTGDIIWIFGDPTKYWYTFPSLRAKSIALVGEGAYPMGQHSPSLTRDGLLLMFNNGDPSLYQPDGAPVGASLPYSIVSAFSIDASNRTAREVWRYAHKEYPPPDLCSSVYEAPDGSLLINYAVWPVSSSATKTSYVTLVRMVGLDSSHQLVFDFQYNNLAFCTTSWAAQPFTFESLSFR